MKKTYTIALLALLAILAVSGVSRAGEPANLERQVVEFTLPNGMKWLLLKRGPAPVFAGIIKVKVGGVDEEEGKTGLAHMLEHMAFKGTKDISPDELWNAFTTNGAEDLNAYTSKDSTAYHAKMPAGKLELWLYLNSEMIKHSLLTDFFKERDVVVEEFMNSQENNPTGLMYKTLLSTAFEKSPYRWSTIGRKDDLTNLQPEYLSEFKKRYYVPERMVGALVGDIDIAEAKQLITRYFGDIRRSGKKATEFPKEPDQNGIRRAVVEFKASPDMMIAYHKPTLPAHDDYVFDLLTFILCEGEDSRLRSDLVFKKRLVRSIDCDSSTPGARLDNLFMIVAEPMKGVSYDEVETAIDAILNDVKGGNVTEAELTKARNNVAKDLIFSMSDNASVAHSLVYFQTVAGDWRYLTRHAGIISSIKAGELVETANKYLVDDNKTVVTLRKK